jgi:hypothetical protein
MVQGQFTEERSVQEAVLITIKTAWYWQKQT